MRPGALPKQAKRRDMILDRRYVQTFSELLMHLGMATVRMDDEITFAEVLKQATARAKRMAHDLAAESQRANRLQAAASPPVPVALPDTEHHVQFRALDPQDGVVIRGEWTPMREAATARAFMEREIEMTDRKDLRMIRLVRCSVFSITSDSGEMPGDEPPF